MCENPIQAWQDLERTTANGSNPILFSLPKDTYDLIVASGHVSKRYREISLPCGHCFSCRRDRAWELTVRASFESRCYDDNSFITLTCADEFLPQVFPSGVCHRPWQLFAKRLRKLVGPFRYLMCAEYGSKTCRPHYHAIIFGHNLVDVGLLPDGTFVPSLKVARCWPYGHVQCDLVNEARLAYVAGYTLKDYQLGRTRQWYNDRGLNLPYVKWSRRPGLGLAYFERFYSSLCKSKIDWRDCQKLTTHHFEGIFGVKKRSFQSRYFFEKLELLDPGLYDKILVDQETARLHPKSLIELQSRIDDSLRRSRCQQYALSLKDRDVTN